MRLPTSLLLILWACLLPSAHADPERGKILYSQFCFTCHGPHLDGGIGPALGDAYWRHGSSPQAILESINKGQPNTEMIAFEAVFPEADRLALRDFILSEQEGLRETVRAVYPREYFKGKRLTPALFETVESLSQTALPENVFYFDRNMNGVLRGTSKLYIKDAGRYQFVTRPVGRTSIFLDGEEVHYSDEKTKKSTHVSKTVELTPGVYDFEVLHEEKTTFSYKFYGYIQQVGGKRFPLNGRSLEGNVPKVIKAQAKAQVVRKWIQDMPPRTLFCLLPNQVIVAYNPANGQIVHAWHSAEVNQTPSLADRSARPSEITGQPISDAAQDLLNASSLRFLHYEVQEGKVRIVSQADGKTKTVTISPKGAQSFTVSVN